MSSQEFKRLLKYKKGPQELILAVLFKDMSLKLKVEF